MSIVKSDYGQQKSGTYRREVTRTWWTQVPFYSLYMLREATAIFMLFYTISLIFGLGAVADGKDAFIKWAEIQSHGTMQWFALISLVMALYHSATWFAATPKVMPLQRGDKKVPAKLIIAANWLAFFFITVIVIALAGLK